LNDPIHSVQSFVEQAYLRMQVADVLTRCLEQRSAQPMHEIVEQLVISGPQSLGVMREILAETGQRHDQVNDDIHQIYADFEKGLKSYGIRLTGVRSPLALTRLATTRFQTLMLNQEIHDSETQQVCLQMMRESRSLIKNLALHKRLLEGLENYFHDGMWALAHQASRGETASN